MNQSNRDNVENDTIGEMIKLKAYHIQPLPKGQELIECKASNTIMFVMSLHCDFYEYFDLVIVPDEEIPISKRLTLSFEHTLENYLPYWHSGNMSKFGDDGHYRPLLHWTMKTNKNFPPCKSRSTVNGYMIKSLFELRNC